LKEYQKKENNDCPTCRNNPMMVKEMTRIERLDYENLKVIGCPSQICEKYMQQMNLKDLERHVKF
jgi:hypothetical protein